MDYLRREILDIEVISPDEFPKPEEANFPISAIALWDSYTNHYYSLVLNGNNGNQNTQKVLQTADWDIYYFGNETNLMIQFVKLIQILNPDTLEGFFSRTFDFLYIYNRLKILGLNPSTLSPLGYASYKNTQFQISGIHILDIVDADIKFKKRTSYSLKNIAIEENLPVKKIDVNLKNIHLAPDKLAEYNKTDVEVTVELDKKMQHIKRYVSRWQLAGLEDIDKAMANSIVVDTVMLREAKKRGILLPSKPERDESVKTKDADITGGMVFTPIIGIHENVMVFDMSRFYPSMIVSLRLSPENISDDGTIIADGTKYLDNPDAILTAIVHQFTVERDRIQTILKNVNPDSLEYQKLIDEDDNAKFLLNAVFGVTGHKGFRLYDPRITNSITMSCQKIIIYAKEYIESKGHTIIYGDTDSVFVKTDNNKLEDIINLGLSLTNDLNSMFPVWMKKEFNVEATSLKIAFDKIFSRLLFISSDKGISVKKRYVGRLIWTMK